jgi:rhodanese-related sulfurtransferase
MSTGPLHGSTVGAPGGAQQVGVSSTKLATWDDAASMDQPHPRAALGIEPIRTISRDELKAKLDHGDGVKLVMALNRWAYDAKHIPSSLHFDTPDALYAALRPDDEIVVYCSQNDCLSSVAVYRDLVARGYRNVRRYSGGLMDWEDAGLPLEGTFVARSAS